MQGTTKECTTSSINFMFEVFQFVSCAWQKGLEAMLQEKNQTIEALQAQLLELQELVADLRKREGQSIAEGNVARLHLRSDRWRLFDS